MPAAIDLIGQRFEGLVVQRRAGHAGAKIRWLCVCDCGKECFVRDGDLLSGKQRSCGCRRAHADRNTSRDRTRHFEKWSIPVTETGCWLWLGVVDKDGYGTRRPHRRSYEHFVGVIPKGLCVLHRCDVPSCINPTHLYVGTAADNNRDRSIRGRSGNQKLSIEDALNMRQMRLDGYTNVQIGEMFAVHPTTAQHAIVGDTTFRSYHRPEPLI